MSLLKTKVLFNASRNFSITSARAAGWNKDWKPGPYPKTEEERKAAAKKYGLLPEEYVPFPDDGLGAGDYPNLKPFSTESRDPFYNWDYPEYRRNFGEVIHSDAVMYSEDRYNVNMKPKYSLLQMLAAFSGVMGVSFILLILGEDACFIPVAKQHMPKPGVKHYTYE